MHPSRAGNMIEAFSSTAGNSTIQPQPFITSSARNPGKPFYFFTFDLLSINRSGSLII